MKRIVVEIFTCAIELKNTAGYRLTKCLSEKVSKSKILKSCMVKRGVNI